MFPLLFPIPKHHTVSDIVVSFEAISSPLNGLYSLYCEFACTVYCITIKRVRSSPCCMHFEFICTVDCFKIKHVFCFVACTFELMYRCSLRNREDVRRCSLIKELFNQPLQQSIPSCGHGLYPLSQAIPFCDRELRSPTMA